MVARESLHRPDPGDPARDDRLLLHLGPGSAHSPAFGLVIGLAILGICVWANGIGALVPLLARRFGVDPALVSAPMISTLVDATGLVIFYSIAIGLLIELNLR